MNENTVFEILVDGELVKFTGGEIIAEVKDIIKRKIYVEEEDSQGNLHIDIYVDPHDGLNADNIKAVEENPAKDYLASFYESMDDHYVIECVMTEESELLNAIERNWNEDKFGEFYEYKDSIREWMMDCVYFNFPYDHYLNQTVQVNIIVDTGDGDYDYTLNNFLSYNASEEEEIQEESSILWLVKQQGYTEQDLISAAESGEHKSKFIVSVIEELKNVTTPMNALSFFVGMSLKDYIAMKESKSDITISADTNCGLYDPWNGAGSLLNIALEKDVTIPAEFAEPHIEGYRGYGVDTIYGMFHDFWKDTVIESK